MTTRPHDNKTNHNGMMGDLSFLESASFWSNVAVVAAAVLTAIAAFCLVYFSSKLSALKDANLERFKEEAGASIASANARAAEANSKAEEARLETLNVSKETALANERTGKLELETARQRELAAKAEKELLELKERLKSRRLTSAQRNTLISLLSSEQKGEIRVLFVGNNSESSTFATDLAEALNASGWVVKGMSSLTLIGKVPVGLAVHMQDITIPRSAALVSALGQVGYPAISRVFPKLEANTVELMVGTKP